MASSLLALIDDIATLLDDVAILTKISAKQAAGAMDDVAALTKVATKKTAGVLGDDLALNAQQVTGVKADRVYVDACSAFLVKRPWDFDVLVTENMFGDILSDLTASLIGGLGMAPSADIGDRHAMFQPCHGTAPDIMGQGKANPTAMILSTAMMLDWLADKHGVESAAEAGERIERAVDRAFAGGLKPTEFGGSNGTADVTNAVLEAL